MSRFNSSTTGATKTTNLAGGGGYTASPELTLVSILLTSFLNDQYYRSGEDTIKGLKKAIADVDVKFAAQAAIFARKEFGMRSVSHVVASELADRIKGEKYARNFYYKILNRPDDMTEIFSLRLADGGKMTKAMAIGFKKYLETLNEYTLAKYRAENKEVKLVDIVNLTHASSKAIDKLVAGKLRNEKTWEATVSEAGKQKDSETAKAKAWKNTLKDMGYMALVKNLCNILESDSSLTDEVAERLVNEKAIKKSLLLPFRYMSAVLEVNKRMPNSNGRKIIGALNDAMEIATDNCPKFDNTCILIDGSGSMGGQTAVNASLFGAILAKNSNADIIIYSESAHKFGYNPSDSILTIANTIVRLMPGSGTNCGAAIKEMDQHYDRVIILSDEQSWMEKNYWNRSASTSDCWKEYTAEWGKSFLISWDLQGYGTLQFPESSVATMAGFSDKCFDIIKLAETDKNALINTIKGIEL